MAVTLKSRFGRKAGNFCVTWSHLPQTGRKASVPVDLCVSSGRHQWQVGKLVEQMALWFQACFITMAHSTMEQQKEILLRHDRELKIRQKEDSIEARE